MKSNEEKIIHEKIKSPIKEQKETEVIQKSPNTLTKEKMIEIKERAEKTIIESTKLNNITKEKAESPIKEKIEI